jgi:hypothetical protein
MLTRAQIAREQALANNPPQATPPVQPQQPQTPAGLGDLGILPPEIRNRIYNLVLPQPERFNLQTYQPHGKLQYVIVGKPTSRVAGQEVAPVDHKRKTEHRCQKRANNEWFEVPSSTALLQLNKQFHAETSSILYGSNKFEFTSTRALERFVIQIGENKKHLREVGLRWQPDGHDAVAGRRAMEALCAAKSLHTVSICGFQITNDQGYKERYMKQHVYMCMPIVRSVLQKRLPRNQHYLDAADVLKVDQRIPEFKPHEYKKGCTVWCKTTCAEHPVNHIWPYAHYCCFKHIKQKGTCRKDFKEYKDQGELLEIKMLFETISQIWKR